MTKKQWKLIIGINLLTILLVLSPFLPGPSFLSRPTNLFFILAQLVGSLGIILIPIGLIWTFNKTNKQDKKVIPILLWSIPILSFYFSIWGADYAREMSRTIAINNAEKLIAAIEIFKENNNHYPDDIFELQPEYIKSIPTP